MLDVADDVFGLLALHKIADERAGEDWIFAEIFKGAAVARLAREVGAAAERHVVALRAKFFADEATVRASGVGIPASRGADVGGKRRGVGAVFAAAGDPVGRLAHFKV